MNLTRGRDALTLRQPTEEPPGVAVTGNYATQIRELAGLMELTPRALLDHSLHFWLKDMMDPDLGLLEAWVTGILKYTKAEQRRILPRIAAWQKKREHEDTVDFSNLPASTRGTLEYAREVLSQARKGKAGAK